MFCRFETGGLLLLLDNDDWRDDGLVLKLRRLEAADRGTFFAAIRSTPTITAITNNKMMFNTLILKISNPLLVVLFPTKLQTIERW